MIYPTVHLNGTSKDELQRQLREAHEAVSHALNVLCRCAPHGRDYYTQGAGVLNIATAEHHERVRRLESVIHELYDIWEHIDH